MDQHQQFDPSDPPPEIKTLIEAVAQYQDVIGSSDKSIADAAWDKVVEMGRLSVCSWATGRTDAEAQWSKIVKTAEERRVSSQSLASTETRCGMPEKQYKAYCEYLECGVYPEFIVDLKAKFSFRALCASFKLRSDGALVKVSNGKELFVLKKSEAMDFLERLHVATGHCYYPSLLRLAGRSVCVVVGSVQDAAKNVTSSCFCDRQALYPKRDEKFRTGTIILSRDNGVLHFSLPHFDGILVERHNSTLKKGNVKLLSITENTAPVHDAIRGFLRSGLIPEWGSGGFRTIMNKYTLHADGRTIVWNSMPHSPILVTDDEGEELLKGIHELLGHPREHFLSPIFKKSLYFRGANLVARRIIQQCGVCQKKGNVVKTASFSSLDRLAIHPIYSENGDRDWDIGLGTIDPSVVARRKKEIEDYINHAEKKAVVAGKFRTSEVDSSMDSLSTTVLHPLLQEALRVRAKIVASRYVPLSCNSNALNRETPPLRVHKEQSKKQTSDEQENKELSCEVKQLPSLDIDIPANAPEASRRTILRKKGSAPSGLRVRFSDRVHYSDDPVVVEQENEEASPTFDMSDMFSDDEFEEDILEDSQANDEETVTDSVSSSVDESSPMECDVEVEERGAKSLPLDRTSSRSQFDVSTVEFGSEMENATDEDNGSVNAPIPQHWTEWSHLTDGMVPVSCLNFWKANCEREKDLRDYSLRRLRARQKSLLTRRLLEIAQNRPWELPAGIYKRMGLLEPQPKNPELERKESEKKKKEEEWVQMNTEPLEYAVGNWPLSGVADGSLSDASEPVSVVESRQRANESFVEEEHPVWPDEDWDAPYVPNFIAMGGGESGSIGYEDDDRDCIVPSTFTRETVADGERLMVLQSPFECASDSTDVPLNKRPRLEPEVDSFFCCPSDVLPCQQLRAPEDRGVSFSETWAVRNPYGATSPIYNPYESMVPSYNPYDANSYEAAGSMYHPYEHTGALYNPYDATGSAYNNPYEVTGEVSRAYEAAGAVYSPYESTDPVHNLYEATGVVSNPYEASGAVSPYEATGPGPNLYEATGVVSNPYEATGAVYNPYEATGLGHNLYEAAVPNDSTFTEL